MEDLVLIEPNVVETTLRSISEVRKLVSAEFLAPYIEKVSKGEKLVKRDFSGFDDLQIDNLED